MAHGKPGKLLWNFTISYSRYGKSWNLCVGHGKSWNSFKIERVQILWKSM